MTAARTAALASLFCLMFVGSTSRVALAEKEHSVDFRLTKWKTLHLHDAEKAEVHFKTLKSLGCEVEKAQHDGHIDLKYRLAKWRTAWFDTDEEAHKWQDYLRGMGFETKHTH